MRRLVVAEYLSVDGRMEMEDPEGREENLGGWTAPYWNDELQKAQYDQLFRSDALLLGRVTYQAFAGSWPLITDSEGFADRMNSLPKFVASTTLEEPLAWNATLLAGDVVGETRRLKRLSGQDILVYGSGVLVRTLMRGGLVDEYQLMVHPLVLGRGQRLFDGDLDRVGLALTGSSTTAKGVVTLVYEQQRPGDPN